MNWALGILIIYAFAALVLCSILLGAEVGRRGRISLDGLVDAVLCALLWPVIGGIVAYERLRHRQDGPQDWP